jgi:hypothetical protein
MKCKLCGQASAPFGSALLLEKHHVEYFRCPACKFIQTEEPYWLEEAYAQPINDSDVGLVGRNVSFAKITQAIIGALFDPRGKFLDYGAGYGLFVRLMRDAGLDYYYSDKHCTNLFARGFEADGQPEQAYELVTAFEVFEHLVCPREEIAQLLQFSSNILFSTTLVPDDAPELSQWWYYGLDHGQHVALYARESLAALARTLGLNLVSDGRQLHLLTKKRTSGLAFRLVSRYRTAVWLARLRQRPSLLAADYARITGKPLR